MKARWAFMTVFVMAATSAMAGTGKQSYNLPDSLPAGTKFFQSVYVEAVGMGAAVAATFQVPPTNPSNLHAGIYHVNPDGTLDTSMAPGGIFIHPDKTRVYALDSEFDKLALAGFWGPPTVSGVPSYLQTFNAFDPGLDPPAIGLDGLGTYVALGHDTVNSRFIAAEGQLQNVVLVVTDESGVIDTSFNGTGVLDTGVFANNLVQVQGAPDGSIVVAIIQQSYWIGNTLILRRYSSTGTLLNSTSSVIGFRFLSDMAIDSQGRIIFGGLYFNQALAMRYTPALQPDSSFGTGGQASFSFLASPGATQCTPGNSLQGCHILAVAVQDDDKILLAGYRNNKVSLAVGRVNTDGTLDTTFGSSGAQYVTISGPLLYEGGGVDVAEDGSIWLLGDTWDTIYPLAGRKALLALLTPDGLLDTSFGSTP